MPKRRNHQKESQKVTYLLIILLVLLITFIFVNRIKYNSEENSLNEEFTLENNINIEGDGLVEGSITELHIAPVRVSCILNSLDGCFVANNLLFPFSIRGFYFEEGTKYNIKIREDIRANGQKVYYLEDILLEEQAKENEILEVLEKFGDYSEAERARFSLPKPKIENITLDINDKESSYAVSFAEDTIEEYIEVDYINNERVGVSIETNITVGSSYVACGGMGEFECLVVDGNIFYGMIDGFEYQQGFEYTLKVRRTFLDSTSLFIGNYRYELLEILSRNEV